MSTSLVHDVGAQYLASVMFALTVLAAGALRTAWRRRTRHRSQQALDLPVDRPEEPVTPDAAYRASGPQQASDMSSDGRRQVSS